MEAGLLSPGRIVRALADMRRNVRAVWEIAARTWNKTDGQVRHRHGLTAANNPCGEPLLQL